jgi:cyanophycinase
MSATGALGLVGGDEFHPGNEPHDQRLVAAAGTGPALVVPTAAARGRPELAVSHAVAWFRQFGLAIEELPVLRRSDAASPELAERARAAGFIYIVGGDPGLLARTLVGSSVGEAMLAAWAAGTVLAGSSAGAMALCAHVLVRDRWPSHSQRKPVPGLGTVAETALLPHFDTFGESWIPSAQSGLPGGTRLLGVDERTCALWDGGRWQCLGAGGVTLIVGAERRHLLAGRVIDGLPAPGGDP